MKFEEWARKEIDITILTDAGERKPPIEETVAMAQAVRARCLDDLMREGPLVERELIVRSLPPDSRHVAPMRMFVVSILKAMAEAGEVLREDEQFPHGHTFTVTAQGRAAFPEAKKKARWQRFMSPDNDRGRSAL